MTQPNLLELAKQGDASAIATLMNRQLQPKGITAKATLKNSCLHIMLEAAQVPNQQTLVALMRKGLTSLGAASIERVKVYGRQTGEQAPAWSQEVELAERSLPLPNSTPVPNSTPDESTTSNLPTQQNQPSLKERARQGDVEAITNLVNIALQQKNITAKASLKDSSLLVMLESLDLPNQETSIRIISRELTSLKVETFKTVKVYGRQTGDEFPSWSQELQGATLANLMPLSTHPQIASYKSIFENIKNSEDLNSFIKKSKDKFASLRKNEDFNKFINFIDEQRNNRKVVLAGSSLLLISVLLIGMRIFNSGYTITGGLTLRSESYEYGEVGRSCTGIRGYDDIHEGTQIVIKDSQGKTIAVAELMAGYKLTSSCFFAWEIKKVRSSEFYTIEIGSGRRGSLTYSKKEMEDRGWKVELSLGD